ncbi:MAG: 16S rRNA (guanine(966)-N(2))-methyltransferase RsmD [Planctomycetes bacterium]|nr:16S rRNA (guanine(966)-N(2))-methyltransferase RsmD [Planctomycetota bacterium]
MLQVIAGEFRSRILKTPKDDALTRPMGSRTKEGLFNILRGWFEGARVLDLFAGVGTLGIEAVSRGASKVFMVEKDRKIHSLLRENIEALGCGERAVAVQADALGEAAISAAAPEVNIVLMDPPFALVETEEGLRQVLEQAARTRKLFLAKGFLILRLPGVSNPPPAIAGFDGPEVRQYGAQQNLLLYMPHFEASQVANPE